jgi:naphthoate synthase/2-ketocyclohexanecarboxyl-CoA hydrolase
MEYQDIKFEKREGVAWITLNRPETYNSILGQTILEMIDAVTTSAEDPEIGVIVFTGAGEKAFSSGGNLKALNARTSDDCRNHMRLFAHLAVAIRTCGKPVIAAVNGYAVGAGHELHLMCDITIAAEHAKFGQTGAKIGSVPVAGATQLLARMVGEKKAREILFMCRQYTANEALEMGLVNLVVPMSELYPTVEQWCRELLEKSPESLRIAKLSLNSESDHNLWGSMFSGFEMLSLHTGSPEFKEGTVSFLEKRKPDFKPFRRAKREAA